MAPDPPSPPPAPNIGAETRDTLQAQIDLAPQQYAATATYQPQYTQLQTQELENATNQLLPWYQQTVYPQVSNLTQTATTAQRQADINDVANLGPEATAAYQAANPQLTKSLDQLTATATNTGPDLLMQRLSQSANDNLTANGQLTPSDQRMATQQARAAFAARGTEMSNPAVLAELENSTNLQQQRLAQATQTAAAVESLGQNQTNATRSFLSSLPAIYAGASLDPFQAILGRSVVAPGVANSTVGTAGSAIAGAGPAQQFNPFNSYASDLYNTQYNAQAAANIGSANQSAGLFGSIFGGLGGLGGGLLSNPYLFM
ncbi:MAG TPA: hypothetical protein VHC95_07140 [Opitutales bacterium]|nr:hypothetical protein [Opitutales bacterium]